MRERERERQRERAFGFTRKCIKFVHVVDKFYISLDLVTPVIW